MTKGVTFSISSKHTHTYISSPLKLLLKRSHEKALKKRSGLKNFALGYDLQGIALC